jgi:glycosyltransferase involved in cell wall biosynthesis
MKIALFTTRPSLSTHCSVWSLLHLLAKDVERIDVFSEDDVLRKLILPDNVRCICVHGNSRSVTPEYARLNSLPLFRNFRDYLKGYILTATLHDAFRDIVQRNFKDRRTIRESRYDKRRLLASVDILKLIDEKCQSGLYDIAIGLGHQGVILAHLSLPATPLVYFSDELYYNGHPGLACAKFSLEKEMEKRAFRNVDLVLIQDEDRARLLFHDNSIVYQPEKVLFFPVSWVGEASVSRSDFFVKRFPELKDKKVLLQHGSLAPERRSGELFQISRQCIEPYAMVFHGGLSPYLRAEYSRSRCWLSQPDLPLERLSDVASGTHIGLVFYTSANENDRLIAHASGQLALYLKCGVPVIVNSSGTIAALVRLWDCGIVVETEKDIFEAADQICDNYEHYCRQAVTCFNYEYNLEKYYRNLVAKLQMIKDAMGK